MTRFTSLLWKEWHEARGYLWTGLGLFLGLPIIGGLQRAFHTARPFELQATEWVVPLGGVLAAFVAVGVTAGERRPRLEDFWRSRPIRIGPWLGAKYAVALAVVLIACGLPVAVELLVDHAPDVPPAGVLTFFPFLWTAIFSLAFLGGCLIARPAHAATLGLTAMLLVYTVPLVVPPLAWLSVPDVFDLHGPRRVGATPAWLDLWGPRQVAFAAGMVGLSALAAIVAISGVVRGWRIESGRRTLYGLIATAGLLLFASAAFQLATNLPVLQRLELPADEYVHLIHSDGDGGGTVVSLTVLPRNGPARDVVNRYWSRPFRVTPAGVTLGPPVPTDSWPNDDYIGTNCLTVGNVVYGVSGYEGPNATTEPVDLQVTDRRGNSNQTLALWTQSVRHGGASLYRWRDRLYVVGDRLDVLDISRPDRPRVLSDAPFIGAAALRGLARPRDGRLVLKLLALPGLPPAQQLDATIRLATFRQCFDGQTLCLWNDTPGLVLSSYRLAGQDAKLATFDEVGAYRPTLLQAWADDFSYGGFTLSHGLVYINGFGSRGTFNSAVSIVDTGGRRPMRQVGHFAAPGADTVCPLPDGRALVGGGSSLWLVGPPPGRAD